MRRIVVICAFLIGSMVATLELPFTVTRKEATQAPTGVPKRRLKILVNNPTLGWSHLQYLGAISDALVDAGHEVHMLTYASNPDVRNYTGTKHVQTIIRHERSEEKYTDFVKNMKEANTFFDGPANMILNGQWHDFIRSEKEICQELIENRPLIQYLKEQKYDFATSEGYTPCMFGIFKLAEVRSMAVSQALSLTALLASNFGIPFFNSFVFDVFTTQTSNPLEMSLWQRLKNIIENISFYYYRDLAYRLQQPLFDAAFGASAPQLQDIIRNTSLAFINSKDFFTFPRPISTKIINIGGITMDKVIQPIPEKFTSIIDRAPKGAVLFSFGTFIDSKLMQPELRQIFVTAFAKFPDYTFIWKFVPGQNVTMDVPSNVHIFDWVPQKTILTHPRLRAFISHCGMNSANEAAINGVPVLGIPLFGDQAYNAALLYSKGLSININIMDVRRRGSAVVEDALRQLFQDDKYTRAGLLLKRKLALTPFSPRERLVKWVEFSAEFSDLNELNMPTEEDMSLVVYYSLDVIFILISTLLLVIFIAYRFFLRITFLFFSALFNKKLSAKKIN